MWTTDIYVDPISKGTHVDDVDVSVMVYPFFDDDDVSIMVYPVLMMMMHQL
jgi:hypothetical protein